MPYVIEPEQSWIRMPENELYAILLHLRDQVLTGSSSSLVTSSVWTLDKLPEDEYFPSRWCDFRCARIPKTFDECDQVNEGLWFLRKGLERYENLQRHHPNRRMRRSKRSAARLDSDSGSDSKSDEAEATSDEESLAMMRKQQAQEVRRMDQRVRDLVGQFQRKYPHWRKAYNTDMRELDQRLEKVECTSDIA